MFFRHYPGLAGIAAEDSFLYLLMLSWHLFVSGKIIVIYVSESERQFLYLRQELIERLIAAVTYYELMKKFIAPYYLFRIAMSDGVFVVAVYFYKGLFFFFCDLLSGKSCCHPLQILTHFQNVYHVFY